MTRLITILMCIPILTGCAKLSVTRKDVFTDRKITITYQGSRYDIMICSDGTISGDVKVIGLIDRSSWIPGTTAVAYPPMYDGWEVHDPGRSIVVFEKKKHGRDEEDRSRKYLYFFRNKLMIFDEGIIEDKNKMVVDYISDFSGKLSELDMSAVFSREQISYFESLKHIRYVKPAAGLHLRQSFSTDSESVDLMNQGDTFYILESRDGEKTVDGVKGKWVYGYWRGLKGWEFDAFLSELRIEINRQARDEYYSKFKLGMFPNFRTVIRELPDRNSRIVLSVIETDSYYYCEPERADQDWVYVEKESIRGYVLKDEIEEVNAMNFQIVNAFKQFAYHGSSGDCVTNYFFKSDGTCDIEYVKTPYNNAGKATGFHVYRYKDIYCLKGGDSDSAYTYFRFKNGIPCGLEIDDEYNTCEKCRGF